MGDPVYGADVVGRLVATLLLSGWGASLPLNPWGHKLTRLPQAPHQHNTTLNTILAAYYWPATGLLLTAPCWPPAARLLLAASYWPTTLGGLLLSRAMHTTTHGPQLGAWARSGYHSSS